MAGCCRCFEHSTTGADTSGRISTCQGCRARSRAAFPETKEAWAPHRTHVLKRIVPVAITHCPCTPGPRHLRPPPHHCDGDRLHPGDCPISAIYPADYNSIKQRGMLSTAMPT